MSLKLLWFRNVVHKNGIVKNIYNLVSWSREVSSKKGRDSRSRETKVGKKIAATSTYV